MSRSTLSLALVATTARVVNARPTYVALLPNGDNVPGVAALGHVNPAGGGANNAFGLDFASADKSWTKVGRELERRCPMEGGSLSPR
ncbi:uncharacterized protein PITG_22951 [Phytophthora infestans T30-4]|uniref:Temptin Cys/Cys disulfide domain-containing protein n=2 Tax=Phytophthora infestans TaxID=4787 RepID=D0NHJ0_PHYIT|nr:uncharacterized protein PITG_22951 [Phytophthora infestans T30-4]EEY58915.1 hypothetical protein PITG_22951 [Phytophthora infestans T30-4]|eukprot:XP_002901388.1 hypothetical protein PITG_22951 [Phytophthora infestans T30-4]